MKTEVETMYLFYFNQFLSVEYFAEYHGLSVERAARILNIGRRLNYRKSVNNALSKLVIKQEFSNEQD